MVGEGRRLYLEERSRRGVCLQGLEEALLCAGAVGSLPTGLHPGAEEGRPGEGSGLDSEDAAAVRDRRRTRSCHEK